MKKLLLLLTFGFVSASQLSAQKMYEFDINSTIVHNNGNPDSVHYGDKVEFILGFTYIGTMNTNEEEKGRFMWETASLIETLRHCEAKWRQFEAGGFQLSAFDSEDVDTPPPSPGRGLSSALTPEDSQTPPTASQINPLASR